MIDPSSDRRPVADDEPFSSSDAARPVDALEDLDSDLGNAFDSLAVRFAQTVPSLVAVVVTVRVDDHPFTLSARVSDNSVTATIAVPLTRSDTASSVLVLAASTPHAFTTVAHDAASELGVGAAIEHDRHLHLFVDVDDARAQSNLSHRSTVDHAIGIMLDRGPADSPAAAQIWLRNAAAQSNRTVVDVARDIAASAQHCKLENED